MTGTPATPDGAQTYDRAFYEKQLSGSQRSAEVILPIVYRHLTPRRVIDIGCGQGTWLAVAASLGSTELTGVDGPWVDPARLRHPAIRFTPADLGGEIPIAERHDLCISVEVAEHLAPERADSLVDALCRAADVVLFSAAVPYQGGTAHVNERRASYWAGKFHVRGYDCVDLIRGEVWNDPRVEWWYRQNCLVFVARGTPVAERLRTAPIPDAPLDVVHPEAFESKMAYLLPSTIARGPRPMNPKLRAVLGIVTGVITAAIVITLIETIGRAMHPWPEGLDFRDTEGMRAYVAGLPTSALVLVVTGWTIGAYVGGVVGASIARRPDPRLVTFSVAGVILAASLFNLFTLPHPAWMLPAAALAIPLAAVLATAVTARGFAKAAARQGASGG